MEERTTPLLPLSSSVVVAQKMSRRVLGRQATTKLAQAAWGSRKQTTISEMEEKKKTKKTKQKVDIKFRCRKPDWQVESD